MNDTKTFPPFDLKRLLNTCFAPEPGERLALLIDLDNPSKVKGMQFVSESEWNVQRFAVEYFYKPLKEHLLEELHLLGGDLFAYEVTGGSNLDLPAQAFDLSGKSLSLIEDILPAYDIVLCISTYSATAPLTALAKKIGFRGATLHGLNKIILDTGLSVDYEEVSRQAEKLRLGMTRAQAAEIDFSVLGRNVSLRLILSEQEAQKSHGLCRGKTPDIANLPAGEVYFVPTGAEGNFPRKFDDGSIAILEVRNGHVVAGELISGKETALSEFLSMIKQDPAAGVIGELGFGTQELPASGRDIQDEKIFGTVHVATGRSDHLGGNITPDLFTNKKNATHEDILFSPTKTPEIDVSRVVMFRAGEETVLIEHFQPSRYLRGLIQ